MVHDTHTRRRRRRSKILLARTVGDVDTKLDVKEVDLYSALIVVPHTHSAQVQIMQCYLQIILYLPLPRKRSSDGTSPD